MDQRPDGSLSGAAEDDFEGLYSLGRRESAVEYVREIWERRDFLLALPQEELRSTHRNTFLGNLWHIGNPVLTVVVYYLVFGLFLGTRAGVDNYVLWLTTGVFAFGLTTSTILGGATSIVSESGLMRSFRFPRAIVVLASTIGNVMTFGFQLMVLLALAVVTGEGISARWVLLPVVVAAQTVFNLGGAFIAARLNDTFSDIQQLIPFVFRLLQFVSGVMIPVSTQIETLPPWIARAIELNPLVPLISMYRWALMGESMSIGGVVSVCVVGVLLVTVGFHFFRSSENRYGWT